MGTSSYHWHRCLFSALHAPPAHHCKGTSNTCRLSEAQASNMRCLGQMPPHTTAASIPLGPHSPLPSNLLMALSATARSAPPSTPLPKWWREAVVQSSACSAARTSAMRGPRVLLSASTHWFSDPFHRT